MRTTIIAFSAAALIAATPAVLARNLSSRTPGQQHKVFKKRPQVVYGYAPWRVVHTRGVKTGYPYPGAFSFAPSVPKDYTYENSRAAGGGGGGGGGGGM
jgi:hypothetical protein